MDDVGGLAVTLHMMLEDLIQKRLDDVMRFIWHGSSLSACSNLCVIAIGILAFFLRFP